MGAADEAAVAEAAAGGAFFGDGQPSPLLLGGDAATEAELTATMEREEPGAYAAFQAYMVGARIRDGAFVLAGRYGRREGLVRLLAAAEQVVDHAGSEPQGLSLSLSLRKGCRDSRVCCSCVSALWCPLVCWTRVDVGALERAPRRRGL